MKTKALMMMVAMCGLALANSRNYYFAPSLGGGIAVTNRGGGLASVGWVVQPIANGNDVTYPPTTNAPFYIDSANGEVYEEAVYQGANQTNIMGYDNVAGTGYIGDGEGSWGTFKYGEGYGYIRFFSDWTVTGAAYYADSSRNALTMFGDPAIIDSVVVISNVNPAYEIPFMVVAPTNGQVALQAMVAAGGLVGTTPFGGANELADSMVSVRWENVTLGTGGYVAAHNGLWQEWNVPLKQSPPEHVTNELRFLAVGQSARAGLPVSKVMTVEVIAVPEPWGVVALVCVVAMGGRRRVVG